MTARRNAALLALALLVAAALAPPALAAPSRGPVYLLRGIGNIFSLGMDTLGASLNREGIATVIINHTQWRSLAEEIIARQRGQRTGAPVVLIGHSLGANAALAIAERLNEAKIRVALIVTYDPTVAMAAGPNVARVVNIENGPASESHVGRGAGFKGQIVVIDVSKRADLDHFNLDEAPDLHRMTIREVRRALGTGR